MGMRMEQSCQSLGLQHRFCNLYRTTTSGWNWLWPFTRWPQGILAVQAGGGAIALVGVGFLTGLL